MKLSLLSSLLFSLSHAQHVIEGTSFGQGPKISPNAYGIPGWSVQGDGHIPQQLSDKVILTPIYPGNKRGSMWSANRVTHAEWSANFQFRATGPEHGGGNLQLWYTKEGKDQIGFASVYTVGKFEGLVLVVDMQGGSGGRVRGFLNDGTTDYSNHHHVESLSFGHCEYSYRNLGRPSRLDIKQDNTGFEVKVDDRLCFRSDNVRLPADNYFGITAASSENPDSFELFKFILSTTSSVTREEPRKDSSNPPAPPKPNAPPPVQDTSPNKDSQLFSPGEEIPDKPASSITSQAEQFSDLHNRIQLISHSLGNLFREVTKDAATASSRDSAMQSLLKSKVDEQSQVLEKRFSNIEATLAALRKEVQDKDYNNHFNDIHTSLKARHDVLLDHLPERVGNIISSRTPNMWTFVFLLVVFQLVLAGSYVVYKRRRSGSSKKYL